MLKRGAGGRGLGGAVSLGQAGQEGTVGRKSKIISYREEAAQIEVGKDREKERGEERERKTERWGESGQGGGAALYGQDSAWKAGSESRDVIPQLYPAVTVRGREVERQRGEARGHGKGDRERRDMVGTRRKKKKPV
jgi:hypothetical protein